MTRIKRVDSGPVG